MADLSALKTLSLGTEQRECFQCGKVGHLARDCRSPHPAGGKKGEGKSKGKDKGKGKSDKGKGKGKGKKGKSKGKGKGFNSLQDIYNVDWPYLEPVVVGQCVLG